MYDTINQGENKFFEIIIWNRDRKKRKETRYPACCYQVLTKPKKTRVKQASKVYHSRNTKAC